ncbi:MAG: hypothetical protein LBK40_04745 [Spirochaetaceae bacterium]|jgi:hypothetical protein|nr:hypothetical protein [Spirochaetaceae bacterium]
MSTDWIPDSDKAFDAHYDNYRRIVNQKTSGSPPEWTHIPAPRITGLNSGYEDWDAAYSKLGHDHSSADVWAKNQAKEDGRHILRTFNNEFILYSSLVSEADKIALGNKPRNQSSPIQDPPTRPEFFIKLVDIMRLAIHFRDLGSGSKAKPYGIAGALIYWAVLDHVPSGLAELTNVVLATRTPHILAFAGLDRGKTVYIAMRWQNTKGRIGPPSEIQSAIIP